ncbi:MAG: amino acid adenylation domain-containing protein [Flavobacterium sp.]|uniref:amino acid adenylation domain-containing protein n=1 Tax=Flavobacterium sp. TaxID=239 RepID=UPI00121FCF02|nr:amino acid adenylation domain-containing protein [Flavobacterium sp.]RZJ65406.1 MAG: amino acid adenylation domain-containing protein [Flavobacterium sp.]
MFSKTILEPFLKAVVEHSAENAFCIDGTFFTYADLARHVSKIRKAVSAKSGSKIVALVANDDIETYASIFALWLEGLAYVPLHPAQPLGRSIEIIGQTQSDLVLSSVKKEEFPIETITTSELEFEGLQLEPNDADDCELAYILFTSGSTGQPKGVTLSRENIGSFMDSFWKSGIELSSADRCLQCFDLTFDVSIQSFLAPLTKGACVYTIPHHEIKYSYVFGLFEDHELTFGAMAPSMVRYLRPYFDEINVPSMRYCILTAEASPKELVEEWQNCLPNAEIFDFYGPTEATIYCTYYKVPTKNAKQLNGMLSIGKPMDGVIALILDENKTEVPKGEKGELCVAGAQLTPGYWQNAEKNAESFFELGHDGKTERFYHTGDLCYFDADGDLMYAGRKDYQVKIQGYRIELGEIEHHARNFLNGKNAVATDFTNALNNTEIALYIETEQIDPTDVTIALKAKLPPYMVPTRIIPLAQFPLNSNDKVDRKTLKLMINEINTTNG